MKRPPLRPLAGSDDGGFSCSKLLVFDVLGVPAMHQMESRSPYKFGAHDVDSALENLVFGPSYTPDTSGIPSVEMATTGLPLGRPMPPLNLNSASRYSFHQWEQGIQAGRIRDNPVMDPQMEAYAFPRVDAIEDISDVLELEQTAAVENAFEQVQTGHERHKSKHEKEE